MKFLVIIDMQRDFLTALDQRTIKACQREIKKAIRNNYHILFVQYGLEDDSVPLPKLTKLTKKYKRTHCVVKQGDDGGHEVAKKIKEFDCRTHTILVCGVNIGCCVAHTIGTMKKLLRKAKFTIIADAVNGWSPHPCRESDEAHKVFIYDRAAERAALLKVEMSHGYRLAPSHHLQRRKKVA